MRLDRLDRFADGRCAVIDYKSGQPQAFEGEALRPAHPQLLAYALAAGPTLAAVGSVHLQGSGLHWRGAVDRAGRLPDIKPPKPGQADPATQLGLWQQRLSALAGEFMAGQARVEPLMGACRHCHLPMLCRIDSLNLGEESDEADAQGAAANGERHGD